MSNVTFTYDPFLTAVKAYETVASGRRVLIAEARFDYRGTGESADYRYDSPSGDAEVRVFTLNDRSNLAEIVGAEFVRWQNDTVAHGFGGSVTRLG